MLLDFGQPLGGIVQYAYVVADIEAAQLNFSEHLGIGPWFVRGPFTPAVARLRGEPNHPSVSLARGFSGHTMVELVAQHDDGPSVYHEVGRPRQYGFHHWATMARDYDACIARYAWAGFTEAYYDELPSGSRICYVESTSGALPGMIEVVEYTDAQERVYTEMFDAARAAHHDRESADADR